MSDKCGGNGVSGSRHRSSRQASEERFERLNDLSPSAKFVYRVLRDGGSLTQDEITDRTLLPKRTVRYALSKLDQADLVEKRPSTQDARTNHYFAKPVERGSDDT